METVGGHLLREHGNLAWLEPPQPLAGIGRLVMTTRRGGISQPPYESLNLGQHVGDVGERVRLNRRSIFSAIGRDLSEPVTAEQVHGTAAQVVGPLHAGTRWERSEKSLAGTDALVTATRRLPLMIQVADCVPVALVCPDRQVAAVAHAGWRGLAGGVLENTLAAMKRTWGSMAEDMVAWIGPAIGSCCYEVGPEVAEAFPHALRAGEGDRSFLDLRSAVQTRLAAAGVLEENLTGLDLCTSCRDDLFFSHRRATLEGKPATGRQALFLWLERAV